MSGWRPDLEADASPVYLRIVEALARDIESGRLSPRERLPTHRDLAGTLGLSVATVTRAYEEAGRRGLVEARVGRGTFVRGFADGSTRWGLASRVDRSLVDLSLLAPPPVADGELEALLRRALRRALDRAPLGEALDYQPHAGHPRHRRAGAEWVRGEGLACDAETVLVCASAQHAMTVALSTLCRPGDVLLTESLTSPGVQDLADWLQLRLHGLPMDEAGLLPAPFESVCRLGIGRTLYTMPTLHNPTSSVMPVERRRRIVEIAREHDVAIVEDAVNAGLASDAPAPLASLAPSQVYYLTSFSKTVAPGLRVAYLTGPAASIERLEAGLRATQWMTSPVLGEVAAAWIEDGTASRALEMRRMEAAARQRLARETLDGFSVRGHETGHHVWLELPEEWSADRFTAAAREVGVAIAPAEVFSAARRHGPPAVRLALSGARTRVELRGALESLRALLERGEEPAAVGPANSGSRRRR